MYAQVADVLACGLDGFNPTGPLAAVVSVVFGGDNSVLFTASATVDIIATYCACFHFFFHLLVSWESIPVETLCSRKKGGRGIMPL